MSAIDYILSTVSNEMMSMIVEEWSDESERFMVHWKPVTLADKQRISKHAKGDDQATTVYTVIFKALDSNGENLFTLADKAALLNSVPSKTVEEIAIKILDIDKGIDLEKP